MNDTMDLIRQMITDHFAIIEREFAIWPEDQFEEELGLELQARFGWTIPQIGGFCLERLARQTAHLSQEDLVDYLRAILWICDRHVILGGRQPDLTEIERHHQIESELYDAAPSSMALLSQVEMHALDANK